MHPPVARVRLRKSSSSASQSSFTANFSPIGTPVEDGRKSHNGGNSNLLDIRRMRSGSSFSDSSQNKSVGGGGRSPHSTTVDPSRSSSSISRGGGRSGPFRMKRKPVNHSGCIRYVGDPSNPNSYSESAQSLSLENGSKNFKVVIRVRPPLPRELHGDFHNVIKVDDTESVIHISDHLNAKFNSNTGIQRNPVSVYGSGGHVFSFDYVYDQECDQKKVYDTTAKVVVDSSLKGYNATIFAYGQTGTGKTYTMEGFNSAHERGIIPRAIEQIFKFISSSASPTKRFLIRASYLQIYNEVISDLLHPERSNLMIREDRKKGVFVEGLSEWVVRSPGEIYGLMERGGTRRATGSHRMNAVSSRSHAVFIIICEQSEISYVDDNGVTISPLQFEEFVRSNSKQSNYNYSKNFKSSNPKKKYDLKSDSSSSSRSRSALPFEEKFEGIDMSKYESNMKKSFKVGKLNLVDLAGSERLRQTGSTGKRLEESKKINQSLSALGNVIAALTDTKGRQHIPYRDSKLTRILEDSLGGNCKTTMMAMCSPALEAFQESLSTLKFANRAKNVKNVARVNEDIDQRSLLRKYERELKRLRAELRSKSQNTIDKRRLLEMDEQRRQAEEDKKAAIRALEASGEEVMREKEEKSKIERKILSLTSQMLKKKKKKNDDVIIVIIVVNIYYSKKI
eukprot:g1705.t1